MLKTFKFTVFFLLACGTLLGFSQAAPAITNLKITADDDYLNILWDNASSDILSQVSGYALQWSQSEIDVRNDKVANLYLEKANGRSLRRQSFLNDTWYYTRVYTYTTNNRRYEIGNGSQVLKWKINYRHEVESSLIDAKDPVIASVVTSSSNSSVSSDLGILRTGVYDRFVDISWSRPRGLASSDYDGYLIEIDDSSDVGSPLGNFKIDVKQYKLRIDSLSPNTTYYLKGHFYKETGGEAKKFGSTAVKTIKTISDVARDGRTARSRNLLKIEKRGIYKKSLTGSTSSDSTTIDITSTSTSGSGINSTTVNGMRARVNEIKAEIKKLQAELNRLELKLGVSPAKISTYSAIKKTTSTSSKNLTKAEKYKRLREVLAARRATRNK